MRKHTVRAITSLSAAVAVLLFVFGTSAALADSRSGQGGRSSVSSGRQAAQSTGRMGRSVRGGTVRGGRYSARRDRGGRRQGWFSRDRRYSERAFISFGGGSSRRGYRSSGFFFGYSFSASEYRRSSGLRYRSDVRREYRSDVARKNASSGRRRAPIEHLGESGPMYVPLVASPAAPEVLPLKD